MQKRSQGFTLLELLMAIAIIAILSTFTISWVNSARAKSRDSKSITELHNVQTALGIYYEQYGVYPNETATLSNPYTDNFNVMAQELVSRGFLAAVPVAPPGHTYQYYNYGDANAGALLFTALESYPASTGYSGSCRPFASGASNWCTTDSNQDYCLCNPY